MDLPTNHAQERIITHLTYSSPQANAMGTLQFAPEPPKCRVLLIWAASDFDSTREQILAALSVAAKNGALLCRNAVSEPFPPPSAPGTPPHRRTGGGRASIRWGIDREECVAWVGSAMFDFDYMCWHDQHGRPWLLDTLQRHHERLQRDVASRLG